MFSFTIQEDINLNIENYYRIEQSLPFLVEVGAKSEMAKDELSCRWGRMKYESHQEKYHLEQEDTGE